MLLFFFFSFFPFFPTLRVVFFPVIPYQQCILWIYSVFSGKSPQSFSCFSSLVPGLALSFLRSDCKGLSYSLTTTNEGGDFFKAYDWETCAQGIVCFVPGTLTTLTLTNKSVPPCGDIKRRDVSSSYFI